MLFIKIKSSGLNLYRIAKTIAVKMVRRPNPAVVP